MKEITGTAHLLLAETCKIVYIYIYIKMRNIIINPSIKYD